MPIKFSTNIQFSYIVDTKRDTIKSASTWPDYLIDGSKYGVYLSVLETNNKLILNNTYNALFRKILVEPEIDSAGVDKLFDEMQFKNNPDVNYLKGLYEYKKKDYKKAKEIFDDVYKVYDTNQNMLNNESEFLYNYINVHRHLQTIP